MAEEQQQQQRPLWQLSAVAAVELLKSGNVTPLQLVEAAEQRWRETDPIINTMPITCWDRAKQKAKQLMELGFPQDPPRGYLFGLPVAVKDLTPVKGLPFTQGVTAYKDRIASADDPLVQRLEEQGAIIVGKTNTPEFGAGSQTFNSLFGTTVNPWDTRKTAGGSSGGSAAALAVGQVWLVTGTDLGGSLRNPAAYCGVVGMRCSAGLVPEGRPHAGQLQDRALPFWRLQSVSGLMARSAQDLALGLDAVVGHHQEDPLSLPAPAESFSATVSARLGPGAAAAAAAAAAAGGDGRRRVARVAFSPDLGVPPVEAEVAALCGAAAAWWGQQGTEVVEAAPDLADMQEVFLRLRAVSSRAMAEHVFSTPELRQCIKADLLWQLQLALDIRQDEVDWAVSAHERMLQGAHAFFQQHDLLLCPTVMLQPFDASIEWPREFGEHKFKTYIDWMKSCSLISGLDLPALSVPCGLTAAGLPVGLQIVGPPGADALVLAEAAAFEQAHQHWKAVPRDVVAGQSGKR